jgi:hypothetical protein
MMARAAVGTSPSSPLQNRVIRLARGVGQRGPDVIGLEIGKIFQDLLVGDPFGQHAEHVGHADAQPPDARSTTAFAWLHRDAFEQRHA